VSGLFREEWQTESVSRLQELYEAEDDEAVRELYAQSIHDRGGILK
jgi:hypothetical protein